jgi:hypothetical protein
MWSASRNTVIVCPTAPRVACVALSAVKHPSQTGIAARTRERREIPLRYVLQTPTPGDSLGSRDGRRGCSTEAISIAMTMYLPNHDILPTGYEVAEFIDGPPARDDIAGGVRPVEPAAARKPAGDDRDGSNGCTSPTV